MSKTAGVLIAVCGAVFAVGCGDDDVGPCDPLAARTLVYSEGVPSYAGQALVSGTCAGAFCHSSKAVNHLDPDNLDFRHGVPAGFNFNLPVSTVDLDDQTLARLRENQERVFLARSDIWSSIESGDMPRISQTINPHMKFAEEAWALPRASRDQVPVMLLGLDTTAGKETVRNWLACGAPVVERVEGTIAPAGASAVGDSVPRDPFASCSRDDECSPTGYRCHLGAGGDPDPTVGECGPPPEWPTLFADVVSRRCAVEGCHGGLPPGRMSPTGMLLLDPDDSDASYANLVGTSAMGSECGGTGTRVIAGEPDNSILIQKLEGNGTPDGAACGDRMPQGGPYLSAGTIAAFREWVAAGASPLPPP